MWGGDKLEGEKEVPVDKLALKDDLSFLIFDALKLDHLWKSYSDDNAAKDAGEDVTELKCAKSCEEECVALKDTNSNIDLCCV